MENLIEKVSNLKKELDKTKEVQEIKEMNKKLHSNKELLDKINNYNITRKESLKEDICNNKFFKEYKEKELNLNIIILKINKSLKKVNSKDKCCL